MSQRMTDVLYTEPAAMVPDVLNSVVHSSQKLERHKHTIFLSLFVPLVILLLTII